MTDAAPSGLRMVAIGACIPFTLGRAEDFRAIPP